MPELEIDDDSITYTDEKRDIKAVITAKLPPGSMKWVVLVILAIFLGIESFPNLGL